jgi:4-diphosphocytidyl-2-C-methyl-D-erythritol kinase
MDKIELTSPAKINLGLYLLEKRPDGYHDILTVFQTIDLQDTITFQKTSTPSISITSEGFPIPLSEDNLISKAIRVFETRTGIQCGLQVHVQKRIPLGAGLGGGSSNAACALKAVNVLYNKGLDDKELESMGSEIGSDVPFFIRGGTAIGEGRGEKLTSITIPDDFHIILLYPDFSVSTAWAYQNAKISLTKDQKMATFRSLFPKLPIHALPQGLANELEDVVFQRHPLLADLKQELIRRDAFYASMSGSGSSVFGLFRTREAAESAHSFFSINGKATSCLCRPVAPVAR